MCLRGRCTWLFWWENRFVELLADIVDIVELCRAIMCVDQQRLAWLGMKSDARVNAEAKREKNNTTRLLPSGTPLLVNGCQVYRQDWMHEV